MYSIDYSDRQLSPQIYFHSHLTGQFPKGDLYPLECILPITVFYSNDTAPGSLYESLYRSL